jgi:hypothetical protein
VVARHVDAVETVRQQPDQADPHARSFIEYFRRAKCMGCIPFVRPCR